MKVNSFFKKLCRALILLVLVAFIHLMLPDGLLGTFLRMFTSRGVLYSEKYSEIRLAAVRLGDTKKSVLLRLGPPLAIYKFRGLEKLEYTQSKIDSWYPLRTITFSNDIVIIKTHYYYTD